MIMKIYKLEGRYLTNKVAMMSAIFGCVYDAVCLSKNHWSEDEVLTVFNRLMQILSFVAKLSMKPYEELGETYDAIEFLDNAAHISKIEEDVNKICSFIKEPIQISIMNYSNYIDRDELFEFVPKFPENKVKIIK